MDRQIDPITRRKRLFKRIAIPVGGVIVLWVVVSPIVGWARPSVDRDDIRIAAV